MTTGRRTEWRALPAAIAVLALATLLIAILPGRGGAAEPYTAYVACGLEESSAPSHECLTTDKKGAFFKSPTDVEYDVCIHFPTQKEICAADQVAIAETLYVNTVTSNIEGLHTVTWKVADTDVATWTFRVRTPGAAGQPDGGNPSGPSGGQDDGQRHCGGRFLVRECAKKYDAAIASVSLGNSLSTVYAMVGRPLRIKRDLRLSLCDALQGKGEDELRLPVSHLVYPDRLTVSVQRVSKSENVCSKYNRFEQPVVVGISTRSRRDLFPNRIHVGSRLRKVQRAFQPKDMRCTLDSRTPAYNACVLELSRPNWKDDDILPGLSMEIRNKRVYRVSLTLFRQLS